MNEKTAEFIKAQQFRKLGSFLLNIVDECSDVIILQTPGWLEEYTERKDR